MYESIEFDKLILNNDDEKLLNNINLFFNFEENEDELFKINFYPISLATLESSEYFKYCVPNCNSAHLYFGLRPKLFIGLVMNCPKFGFLIPAYGPAKLVGIAAKLKLTGRLKFFPKLNVGVKLKRTWFQGFRGV